MAKNVAFESFSQQVEASLRLNPGNETLMNAKRVLTKTAEFLGSNNYVTTQAGGAAALENLEHAPKLNSSLNISSDSDVQGSIESYIQQVAPDVHKDPRRLSAMTKQIGRILAGDNASIEHFGSERDDGSNRVPLFNLVGASAYASIARDAANATEAFGVDIDRISSDVRLNVALTVLRSFKSLTDRVLARIVEQDSVVTIKIPENEVYDLSKSGDPSAAVRYGGTHRQPMIALYRNADPVSTAPKKVIPDSDNDTGTVSVMVDESLAMGRIANLFDLTMDANRVGFQNVDYTDTIAEGGTVESIYVQVTKDNGEDPDTVEVFKIDVRWLAASRFIMVGNASDSGDRQASIRHIDAKNLISGGLMANGAATVIFNGVTNYFYRLTIDCTVKLNLKDGNVSASGSVMGAFAKKTDGTAPVEDSAEETLAAALSVELLSYDLNVYFSEENVRKATVAVRQNFRPHTFEIPAGRTAVVDVSLQQSSPEAAIDAVSTVNALGNSARAMDIYDSHLDMVAARNTYEDLEAGGLPYQQTIARDYAAGSLVLPRVIKATINLADEADEVAIMRESEKLSDLHARVRNRMLALIAQVNVKSLYPNVLDAGETPVWKVIGHSVLVDMLFGIDDYHNALNDAPEGGRKQAGSDYSMMLPNGTRLDIYKTDFTKVKDRFVAFPVRASNPEDITSFATIRDRGTFVGSFTRTDASLANKRFITNSREIPFVTNPVGVSVAVTGLSTYFPELAA